MIGWLEKIWCAILAIGVGIVAGIVQYVVNPLILAFGTLAGALIGLLPGMPDVPAAPDGGVVQALNWMLPLGAMLSAFAGLTVLWLTWIAVQAGLRWVKAIQ